MTPMTHGPNPVLATRQDLSAPLSSAAVPEPTWISSSADDAPWSVDAPVGPVLAFPVVVIRPMVLFPELVNHSALSGPLVMLNGSLILGPEKFMTSPSVVIRPIKLLLINPLLLMNHSAPSGPAVMLRGPSAWVIITVCGRVMRYRRRLASDTGVEAGIRCGDDDSASDGQ